VTSVGAKGGVKIAPQAQPRELIQSFSKFLVAIISSPPDYFASIMAGLRKAYNPKHDYSAAPQTCSWRHTALQAPDPTAPSSVFRKST
jgi:hypothetical protein